jgi:DNA-binding transcriptional LysR family regulator
MPYDGRLLSGVTVLMAVVEARSMAHAAEALGLTPSGVGRAIARLESRVGVRLLERTTRSMALTDEGRRFYEEVGPHLDGIEQAATGRPAQPSLYAGAFGSILIRFARSPRRSDRRFPREAPGGAHRADHA